MRILLLIITLSVAVNCFAQDETRISTMEFVQILNNNRAEALFYFKNNWQKLREKALAKGYIYSFQLLETKASEEADFELILVTTYRDQEQYDLREEHFRELIDAGGKLRLLNDKMPGEFRKSLFSTEVIKHWQ